MGGSSVKNRISSIFVVDKNERRKLQHVLNKDECQEKSMTSKIVREKLIANLVADILAHIKKIGNLSLKT